MPVQALSPPTPQKPKVTLSPCRGLCYCQGLDLHSYTLWVGMENAELESSNPPRISKKNGRSGIRIASARRQAGRSSGAVPDKIRDGREPQDRQGARP